MLRVRFHSLTQFETVEPGHPEVGDHEVDLLILDDSPRFFPVDRLENGISGAR